MVRFGAHAVRNGAGEVLLALCCGQCCDYEKTKDQRLQNCSFNLISTMSIEIGLQMRPEPETGWAQAAREAAPGFFGHYVGRNIPVWLF